MSPTWSRGAGPCLRVGPEGEGEGSVDGGGGGGRGGWVSGSDVVEGGRFGWVGGRGAEVYAGWGGGDGRTATSAQ